MYELQFLATDDADWAVAIELIDDATNRVLDIDGLSFELEIKKHGHARLRLSTADGTITSPQAGTIQWQVPRDQMRGLRAENSYELGCVVTSDGGTDQLFIGTLAFIDGGLA